MTSEKRSVNFSAGPAMLPLAVLEKAAKEITNYQGLGYSIMEASHRSPEFKAVHAGVQCKLLKHMELSADDYQVLLLQGGASSMFYQIPMNVLKAGNKADYIDTGSWTKKAIKEAKRYGDIQVVKSSAESNYNYIPQTSASDFRSDARYLYLCANNTIFGTRYATFPETSLPLVGDFSSEILSRKVDYSRFGVIFAGAQKNLGPAGVTVVVVKKDLLAQCKEDLPSMLSFKNQAENDSMFNTPPTYGIYLLGLILDWIEEQGGVSGVEAVNEKKAALLYDVLDERDIYTPTAKKEDRSRMNITFTLPDEDSTTRFLSEAGKEGFVNLKGHRSVGGIRASIYNAMPLADVERFSAFLKNFS